jgi:hypothetical protein
MTQAHLNAIESLSRERFRDPRATQQDLFPSSYQMGDAVHWRHHDHWPGKIVSSVTEKNATVYQVDLGGGLTINVRPQDLRPRIASY